MRAVAETLKEFLSGFDLPAYATDSIPKDVELPYLTYPIVEPEWDQKATFYVQGWFRTKSFEPVLEKADEIAREISTGVILSMREGSLVIYPESPLIQTLTDGDTKSFYLNLSINAYHMPGV